MRKLLYAIVIAIFVIYGTIPVYATVTDVNIVPPPPPSAPTDVSVSGVTDTGALVSWLAVTSALQYTVYLNGQVYSGSNSPQASLTGLTPHTTYELYVIANNTGGNSSQSTTMTFMTLSTVPTAPSDPTLTTTSTTAKLIWQPLAANYNITQYTVYIDGQVKTTVQPQAGMQTTTLDNLTAGSHFVALSATNDNREGPQSQPVSFKISTVPAPLGVQFYNKSADTIWSAWQPVPGASSYNILVDGQPIGQTYQSSYIIQGLKPDTAYQISFVTVMPNGEQSQGTNLSVQTESSIPPSITNLEDHIFTYVSDLQMYIEILFGVIAALTLSKNLRLIFRR